MTNTRSLTWDLSWGIGYQAKLGPYRPPTSFKHRVRKCGLKCTWPVIGYTRIWCTGTSFLLKKSYLFVVVFFSAYIFLRLPHDLNACNRLWKTRSPYFHRAETWRLQVTLCFRRVYKIWKRVISVLPWFSKLLEKFMYKRGIKFLDKHNIIGGSLGSNWR